jgi:hypothetical protein
MLACSLPAVACSGYDCGHDPAFDSKSWYPISYDKPLPKLKVTGWYEWHDEAMGSACHGNQDENAPRELNADEIAHATRLIPALDFTSADEVTFRVTPRKSPDQMGLLHVEYVIDGHTVVDTFRLAYPADPPMP